MSSSSPTPATLADVARQAGISVPTASRALRDHPDVSPQTRERVQVLAQALGYRTSAAAKALRTGRHDALSLVLPEKSYGWWEPLTKGASRAAAEGGFHILLTPIRPDEGEGVLAAGKEIGEFFQYSSALPVDGFIVVTPEGDDWKAQTDRPVVIIDDMRPHPGHHVLRADNVEGARLATEHLLATGRRSVVAVAPDWSGEVVSDRLRGYTEAMLAAGLKPRVRHTDGQYPPTAEYSNVIEDLTATGEDLDGVFALADYLTFAIFRSLRRSGRRVPEDVAVVGFDDDGLAAIATDPMLTTVAQPLEQIGATAVQTLIRLIRGEALEPRAHILPTRLVVRGSA